MLQLEKEHKEVKKEIFIDVNEKRNYMLELQKNKIISKVDDNIFVNKLNQENILILNEINDLINEKEKVIRKYSEKFFIFDVLQVWLFLIGVIITSVILREYIKEQFLSVISLPIQIYIQCLLWKYIENKKHKSKKHISIKNEIKAIDEKINTKTILLNKNNFFNIENNNELPIEEKLIGQEINKLKDELTSIGFMEELLFKKKQEVKTISFNVKNLMNMVMLYRLKKENDKNLIVYEL